MKWKALPYIVELKEFFTRTRPPENSIILLTDCENEIVFSKIKEMFQTCVIYRDTETKTFSDLKLFTFEFFSIYIQKYIKEKLKLSKEKKSIAIVILTFPLVDNRGNVLQILSIAIGKDKTIRSRDIVLKEFSEPFVRILTIKTLQDLYKELKHPHAL